MDLIVTHDSSDFDAFASMVAASKLYPGARLSLGRRQSPAVRRFLSLHRDVFETIRYNEIVAEEVGRLIVVDVRRRSRLRDYQAILDRLDAPEGAIELHLYDHHAATDDDLESPHAQVELVGATVTLLVETLRERGLAVDPQEATLMALGIYSDTDAFRHPTTTARDLAAGAWLLNHGACLAMVRRFLAPPFSESQRRVLRSVLAALETRAIEGAEIAFAEVHLPKAIDGFAEVIDQTIAIEEVDAVFGLFVLGERRVQVVGRARRPYLHVGEVLKAVGGGGHPGAASAMVKNGDAADARRAIIEALRRSMRRPKRLADVMSSPVHTVEHTTPLLELESSLFAWHHTGAPVMRDGKVVGIISHRDIERARRRDRLRHAASSAMSAKVHSARPEESIEAALERMTKYDIGRLPVLEKGELVGIVTRTDLLRLLYAEEASI